MVPPPAVAPAGMVDIPAGCFFMGSPENEGDSHERPAHVVNYPEFAIDKHPVTAAAYAEFLKAQGNVCQSDGITWPCYDCDDADGPIDCANGYAVKSQCQAQAGGAADQSCADHPVVEVSWYGAAGYCGWAGKSVEAPWTGKRLPTEAEWERAANGPAGDDCSGWRRFTWGMTAPNEFYWDFYSGFYLGWDVTQDTSWAEGGARINCVEGDCFDGWTKTSPVGAHPAGATAEGLHDLVGNVQQWVADDWHPSYEGAPADGSAWIDGGDYKIRRGTSYFGAGRTARVAYRAMEPASAMREYTGFRCAATRGDLPQAPASGTGQTPPPGPPTWGGTMRAFHLEHCAPCHLGTEHAHCQAGVCLSSSYQALTQWKTCCGGPPSVSPEAPICDSPVVTAAQCGLERALLFPEAGKDPLPPEQLDLLSAWLDAGVPE